MQTYVLDTHKNRVSEVILLNVQITVKGRREEYQFC